MLSPSVPVATVALSVLVALLAGCSATDDASAAAQESTSADVRVGLLDYSFERSARRLAATTVTLTVTNTGGTEHDLQVLDGEQVLGATRMLQPGERQTITVDLSGLEEVTFLCTVPGHEQMGMVEDVGVAPTSDAATTSTTTTSQEEPAT